MPSDSVFPAYTGFEPRVPVHCVTPGLPGCIHRFYDSSPFSPSGRYLAVTRFPVASSSLSAGMAVRLILVADNDWPN